MEPVDAMELENDILQYNDLLRHMVSDMAHPIKDGEPSIFVQYRARGLSSYTVTSLEGAAKGIRRSAEECLKLDIQAKERKIDQAKEKIKTLEKQLENYQKIKSSLVARSRARKKGDKLPKFENYFGSGIYPEKQKDGSLCIVVDHHRGKKGKRKYPPLVFENEYLFETQYLNRSIRNKKHQIRQIKGRLHNLQTKLDQLNARKKAGKVKVRFGGKKLMQQRHTTNDVAAWRKEFARARTREMMLTGRYDAPQGNFMVSYDSMNQCFEYTAISGRKIKLYNVFFPYGQDEIENAVTASIINTQNKGLPENQKTPCWPLKPVTWSIKDCGNAFQIKCTITIPDNKNMNICYDDGCVAFDMNYDHLAVAEINQYGQLKTHFTVPFKMDGRTSGQIENALSEALEKVFKHAAAVKKPIAMEDIKDVKKDLMYGNRTRNRKISQFAYDKITTLAESKSQKYGIAVRKVNPAYTSQIGKMKYMRKMGLSIHIAAAYVIGRRAMGFKDKVPKEMRHLIPKAKRNKHHWSQWAGLSSPLKTIRVCKFYENINYKAYSSMTALKKALAG